ncbi:hypothetical protein [Mucilaginibacter segetis]|uniref:Uncharacterized protein n=1 Tax=Mucilaginibacter segetis TaxID=2793071 RepID=A0A934UMF9_9SPHI|nr:hypothetical protein [Mucilaginibacter segetis]MBK0378846.1 hypothetical protein [Mucilaginibacter segetis]
MKDHKPIERRTFLQDRFDILIKKQRNGQATFNDLTELDDIVNRVPSIRESILEEMHQYDHPAEPPAADQTDLSKLPLKPQGLLEQLRSFINRLFISALYRPGTAYVQ